MKTIHLNADNLSYWNQHMQESVVALGFFDGIHSGHEKVIRTAGEIAKEKNVAHAVMSFSPHPKTVLSKSKEPFDYLMPLSKKAAVLESLGVDFFYLVKFDKDFLSLRPEQFVRSYLYDMSIVHAVAGFDFSYGHRGAGNIDCLKEDSGQKIDVTKVNEVTFRGETISSSCVRQLIHQGDMEKLEHILGRHYETEVYWDEESFKVSPHFMLPPEGNYQIILQTTKHFQETEIYVNADRNQIYLLLNTKQRFSQNEKAEIIWLRQRIQERVSI